MINTNALNAFDDYLTEQGPEFNAALELGVKKIEMIDRIMNSLILEIEKDKSLTHQVIADRMGVHKSSVSRMLSGTKRSNPTLETICALAVAIGVDLNVTSSGSSAYGQTVSESLNA